MPLFDVTLQQGSLPVHQRARESMWNEGAMAWATSDAWTTRYDPREDATDGQRHLYTQLILSVALGFSAFISI